MAEERLMRNRILFLLFFISIVVGQQSFTAHTISTSADGARSVYAVDVDGDGDMDVLSASQGDDKIAWYENNGSESFTAHTISSSADRAWSVYAVDVDRDGDIDVLSASMWMTKSPGMRTTAQRVSPPIPFLPMLMELCLCMRWM